VIKRHNTGNMAGQTETGRDGEIGNWKENTQGGRGSEKNTDSFEGFSDLCRAAAA
jgi:hypothetical protein